MNALDVPSFTIGSVSGDHITFTITDIVPDTLPTAGDFSASIAVSCAGFHSPPRNFWFDRDAFDEFLGQLRCFENSRVGAATLNSMSPDEFALRIAADSPTQWPTVSGTVTGPNYSRYHRYRAELAFALTLDSSFVAQLLRDFESILPNGRSVKP